MENKEKIKLIVKACLKQSAEAMEAKIEKAIKSGALDISNWDEKFNSMIIPKTIVIALLEDEADQYKARGTSFEKQIKKDVNNLKCCL